MHYVVWLDSALEDLHVIAEFIAERDTNAARLLVARLIDDADGLGVLPAQYKRGRVPGTHELVAHPNYILVYRYTVDSIEVLNVLHVRQQYPR